MRIRTVKVCLAGLSAVLSVSGLALADEQANADAAVGAAASPSCEKPAKPILVRDRSLKGRKAFDAHNANIRRYNAYVAEANGYMACLSAEADKEIKSHFLAVAAKLEREQQSTMAGLDDLMRDINSSQPAASVGSADARLETELLGGPDQPEE